MTGAKPSADTSKCTCVGRWAYPDARDKITDWTIERMVIRIGATVRTTYRRSLPVIDAAQRHQPGF